MPLAAEAAWALARNSKMVDPRRDIRVAGERTHTHQTFETSNAHLVNYHLQLGILPTNRSLCHENSPERIHSAHVYKGQTRLQEILGGNSMSSESI